MRTKQVEGPVDCAAFRRWVYHLQADELAETDRDRLLDHVGDCPRCEGYLEIEESFLRGLKSRLRGPGAPPGLDGRIREALRHESAEAPRGMSRWLRTPAASAAAAAALLLVLFLAPIARRDPAAGAVPGAMHLTRAVTVVDLDCDLAGRSIAEQRACRDPLHHNVLKVGGAYWNVNLGHPAARDLVLDPGHRGRRLVVEANFYPELHAVQLIRVRDADPVRL